MVARGEDALPAQLHGLGDAAAHWLACWYVYGQAQGSAALPRHLRDRRPWMTCRAPRTALKQCPSGRQAGLLHDAPGVQGHVGSGASFQHNLSVCGQ